MKSLDKRIFRDLKTNLGKYASIFILLAVTIAFGSSFLVVVDSTEISLNKNQEEKVLENGNFTLKNPYTFNNNDIEENFYINLEDTNTLRIYKNRIRINQLSVLEGRVARNKNEIAIDRAFANSNGIKVGDNITYENHTLKVVGFVSVPDYTSLFKDNDDLMMNTTDFGIGFVSNDTFNILDNGYNVIYNYSFIGNKDEVKDNLIKNSNVELESFMPKELNQSIQFLYDDIGTDVPMMKVLIVIVIVIIAFVFVVLLANKIELDSKAIGTLKALGYTNKEIIFHYIKLPLIISLVAAIVGNIVGYTLFINPFKDILFVTYSVPPFDIVLNSEAFFLTTLIPLVIIFLILYFSIKRKINNKPIDFLRNNIKKTKTRMIRLSSKISFKNRFKLRVFFDNIINFIVLFLGIYLASLILIFGIGLKPVIKNYEEEMITSAVSNYQYILKTPIDVDAYKLTQYKMKTYYKLGDRDLDVIFMGINNTDKYFKDLKLYNLNDGIVISDVFAKKFKYKVNDIIKFRDDIKNKEYEYKILDIYDYQTSFAVFMPQKDLNNLIGFNDEYFNTILSDDELNIGEQYIKQEITRDELGNIASQMMASFEGMLQSVNIFAVIIYLVLMYVLTKVIIERSTLQISLLKVFGYDKNEIKNLYLNGTTIAVILILIVTIPLEKVSYDGLMQVVMMKVAGYMEANIPLKTYLLTVITGVISYLVINRFQIYKINKVPLEEALKERE